MAGIQNDRILLNRFFVQMVMDVEVSIKSPKRYTSSLSGRMFIQSSIFALAAATIFSSDENIKFPPRAAIEWLEYV